MKLTSGDVRARYRQFFEKHGHKSIPPAPLVLANDPTTLFTSSGMQPLVPYLLGQPHPLGKRLVDVQPSLRLEDIDEVGDNRHTTFFEMLGNWSLGDYFKKEQLTWFFEFLTKDLGLSKERLYVSLFEGNQSVPKDNESLAIWKSLGVVDNHIFFYGVNRNWWSRSGPPDKMPPGEPGGPDSEVFFDFGADLKLHENSLFKNEPCHPNCDCGRFLEIGNSVFMQYVKTESGALEELPNKNVDFGGGLERMTAAVNNDPDIFKIDTLAPVIQSIEDVTESSYDNSEQCSSMRVVADHIRAATFLIGDGVVPSNKAQGYILRRLLRRAAVKMHTLVGGLTPIPGFQEISKTVLAVYNDSEYFRKANIKSLVDSVIADEMNKFGTSLDRGLKEFNKMSEEQLPSLFAFNLFQTYGFPFEITEELFRQKGKQLSRAEFDEIYRGHKELSRKASAGMFKGGLADHSEAVTKYHSATHLLHAALRQVLGDHVHQDGSNITGERLRFDFTHPTKLTADEIREVEAIVNEKIKENLLRKVETKPYQEAVDSGALAFFKQRYPDIVTVYSFGDFSREVCGGPHVESTGQIGPIKIFKSEKIAAGVQRLYASLD
jgi:alanyl-tRNA synthetase